MFASRMQTCSSTNLRPNTRALIAGAWSWRAARRCCSPTQWDSSRSCPPRCALLARNAGRQQIAAGRAAHQQFAPLQDSFRPIATRSWLLCSGPVRPIHRLLECRPSSRIPLYFHCWLQLVAAFRATLEEIQDASLLLHVVDVSHPNAPAQVLACQLGCVVVCALLIGAAAV